jgi:hypothetical protein
MPTANVNVPQQRTVGHLDSLSTVRLTGATRLRIKIAAAHMDMGVGDLINLAVNDYLDRNPTDHTVRGEQSQNG